MSLQLALKLLSDFSFKDKVLKDAQCLMKLLRWYIEVFGWNDDVRRLISILSNGVSSISGARNWMSFGAYLAELYRLHENMKKDGVVKTSLSLDTFQSLLSIAQGTLGDVMTVGNSDMIPRDSMLMKRAGELSDRIWLVLSLILFWRSIHRLVREDTVEKHFDAVETGVREESKEEESPAIEEKPDTGVPKPSESPVSQPSRKQAGGKHQLLSVFKAGIDFGLACDNFFPWVPDEGSSIMLNLTSAFIGTYTTWEKHVAEEGEA